MRPILCLLAVCCSVLGVSPCLAHHSFAMFDPAKKVTITGAVKDLQWTNPHVVIWVLVTPAGGGAPETWTVELTSPGNLTRCGWTRHSVTQGDRVAVDIAPLRDGSHGGGFEKLTLLDTGKVLTANFGVLERPGVQ